MFILRSSPWFAALALAGCASQETGQAAPPVQPEGPPAELAVLAPLVGSWSGVAELVLPEGEAPPMPEGAEEMPTSFPGGSTGQWVLGGMFLKLDGWFEMGPGQRVSTVEYYTWDPATERIRSFYFNDWGEAGEGWWTPRPDGRSFTITAESRRADGTVVTGTGTITFVDDDTMEFTWEEGGSGGGMKMKGTSRRRR